MWSQNYLRAKHMSGVQKTCVIGVQQIGMIKKIAIQVF